MMEMAGLVALVLVIYFLSEKEHAKERKDLLKAVMAKNLAEYTASNQIESGEFELPELPEIEEVSDLDYKKWSKHIERELTEGLDNYEEE